MNRFLTQPWLKAYSGLFINISAALIITPLVGYSVSLPKNLIEFGMLFADLVSGIIFLLLTVKCEERIKK